MKKLIIQYVFRFYFFSFFSGLGKWEKEDWDHEQIKRGGNVNQ